MTDGLHLEELLAGAVFTGARVSGLMVFCPFLGSNAVPVPPADQKWLSQLGDTAGAVIL